MFLIFICLDLELERRTQELNHKQEQTCPFQPQLLANASSIQKPANYNQLNGKSIEKYLMKQNHARNLKTEAELHAQKVFSAGRNWTPHVTRPKMPNITAAYRQAPDQMSKHP